MGVTPCPRQPRSSACFMPGPPIWLVSACQLLWRVSPVPKFLWLWPQLCYHRVMGMSVWTKGRCGNQNLQTHPREVWSAASTSWGVRPMGSPLQRTQTQTYGVWLPFIPIHSLSHIYYLNLNSLILKWRGHPLGLWGNWKKKKLCERALWIAKCLFK